MKTSLAHTTLVVLLSLSGPTHANDVAPVSPTLRASIPDASDAQPRATAARAVTPKATSDEPRLPELFHAYVSVAQELTPVLGIDDVKSRIQKLVRFEFSDETQKKLIALFANAHPLHLTTKTLTRGDAQVSFAVDALEHKNATTGTTLRTPTLSGTAVYSQHYTKEHTATRLPWMIFGDSQTLVAARDFSYITDRRLGAGGLWLGTGVAKLDQLTIDAAKSLHLKFDALSSKAEITSHGKLVDLYSDSAVQSINWGSDGLGPLHLTYRVTNIDAKALADLAAKVKAMNISDPSDAQNRAAVVGTFKAFGLATLTHGAVIDIQDASLQYHGMTAGLNGRITFDNIQESDFETPKLVIDKIKAHFEVHVPVALVGDVSRAFARSSLQTKHKGGAPVTESDVDSLAKPMVDKLIDKALKEKWIRIENNTILSTIEFGMGKLSVNGKTLALPGVTPQP